LSSVGYLHLPVTTRTGSQTETVSVTTFKKLLLPIHRNP
jgi:hypothetical protein